MRRRVLVLILVVASLLTLLGAAVVSTAATGIGTGQVQPQAAHAEGRLLVRFRPLATDAMAHAILAGDSLAIIGRIDPIDVYVVSVPAGREAEVARELKRNLAVQYAEPDYIVRALRVPDDPYFAVDQWNLTQIGGPAAWDLTTGSADVVIAVVDTGVDVGHPDLASKIVAGYDFVNLDDNPQDDEGHGSHIAGIAAAVSNNTVGVSGVSWGARIMPVKVLDTDGSGYTSDVAAGIAWAADHGARVINLSLGGPGASQTLQDAVDHAYSAGALIVAAAGNEYQSGNPANYPAACEHVIGVAATNDQDGHATYSSAGSWVDVAAPGGDPTSSSDPNPRHWIMSTYWRGASAASAERQAIQAAYERHAGTSMATPHVAGLAALIWSRHPEWSHDQVTWAIESTALDRGAAGRDDFFGWGRIDAGAAVALAVLQPTPTPTPSTCLAESPHPYASNTDRTWTITNTDTTAVYSKIHFSRLETESGYDQVIIRDASGMEVQSLSGSYPSGTWSAPVPGRTMQVQLRTDNSITGWGFCVDSIETYTPTTPAPQPIIAVAPRELSASVPVSGSAQQTLVISNSGQATLTFSITDVDTTPGEMVSIHLPQARKSSDRSGLKSTSRGVLDGAARELRANRGLAASAIVSVLIVTVDSDVSDLQASLAAFPDLQVAVYNDAAVPTLAQLQAYDVVLTSDNRYWAAGGMDPTDLGDVLAGYVDAGGRVVVANYGYDYDRWAILGRFLNEDYGPFERATADLSNEVHLGSFTAGHPIMQGVTSLTESGIHQDPTVGAGATLVASWSDGTPLVATRPWVVGINLLGSLGDGTHGWTGDAPTLLHNAIVWVSGGGGGGDAPWLSETPDAGAVPEGGSTEVDVNFAAGGLASGRYTANLLINSNDPGSPQVVVPVTMTVGSAGQVSIYVDPPAKLAGPDGYFSISLKIASGAQGVDAADARLSFDPAYLRVVDSDGEETDRIEPGATLPTVLQNAADNGLGRIAYSAGRELSGTVPSGDFVLGIIRFKALTLTQEAGTPLSFISGTEAYFGGDPILDERRDGVVFVQPPVLVGRALLQGRGQPPSARWLGYDVQVMLYPSGVATPTQSYAAQLDASGQFTVTGMSTGQYDVVVKGSHSLSNRKVAIALPREDLPVDFGTLLEGDANGDDAVAGDDFSILAAAYATMTGDPTWDARADFNGDGVINGADFSLLATNYGRTGPIWVARVGSLRVDGATFRVISPGRAVALGSLFEVALEVWAPDSGIDAADAYLEYDPAYLSVVDAAVAPAQPLPVVLQNAIDLEGGAVAFSVGRELGGTAPNGVRKVAVVRFRALQPTGPDGTAIRFGTRTGVYGSGEAMLGAAIDGAVIVAPWTRDVLYLPQLMR